MATKDIDHGHHVDDGGASARKEIWRTTAILSCLTTFEFLMAFTKKFYPQWFGVSESTSSTLVLVTFVLLTIVKAFYIVAYFMHLKHELRRLMLTILIPFMFIVWLIIGLLLEGGFWGEG